MQKPRRTKGLESQLRQAIAKSGMSLRQLAAASGVDAAQLSYFAQGKRTLTLRSAQKIADALGLDLRPVGKPKKVR